MEFKKRVKVKIISDGIGQGTQVILDDKDISACVKAITWRVEAGGIGLATVELHAELLLPEMNITTEAELVPPKAGD